MPDVELFIPFIDNGSDYLNGWWNNFKNWLNVDVCFLHRPFGYYGAQIIEASKIHGVPLWVDHDDDLLAIPKQNPCYGIIEEDKKWETIERSYREADALTYQSPLMGQELKEKYNIHHAIHIPITLDDRLLRFKKPHTKNNKIAWRGSPSHISDLKHHQENLQKMFNSNSEKEFHFFGINPQALGFKIKNLVIHPEQPMFRFYRDLCETNAQTQIVCLEDNYFNRVKSHLAWLDGTLAGSDVIFPGDFEGFRDCFLDHDRSWERIKTCFLTSHWNETRRQILWGLTE